MKDAVKTRRKNQRKNSGRHTDSVDDQSAQSLVSTEALRGVTAIFAIALAGFLVIAQVGGGGAFGRTIFDVFSWLLGVGYILLPLSLVLLAIATLRSLERHLGWVQAVSIFVFLSASLGIIELIFRTHGGVIGHYITYPLITFIDITATAIFLIAFIIASLVIAFDTNLGATLAWVRDRLVTWMYPVPSADTPTPIGDAQIVNMPIEVEQPTTPTNPSNDTHDDTPKEDPPARKSIVSMFTQKDVGEDFPAIALGGAVYVPPPISILAKNRGKPEVGDVKANMNVIKRTLQNFGIQVEMDEASIGPTVTRYSMKPAEGVRLSKILTLQSNLELALAASPVRIEAPIPGKSLVGVEVPNISRTTLGLAPLVADEQYTSSEKPLLISLGRSITGHPHFADIAKMPHLLVAGTTGAGKSVTIHDFVVSLLYRCGPEKLRFIMVDPKRVELTLYNSIPHLLTPVITDAKKAILALKWLAKEMDRRYNVLEAEKVRDIASYHQNIVAPAVARNKAGIIENDATMPEAMPYIVLIIDELADIMQAYPRELESGIVRLAQMSRAVGIHLILSTQRPSVKVITGLIKANIPARLALQVSSQIDSRTILDMGGAEKLLGAGDMLFLSGEMSKPRRIQAPYISEDEVKKVVAYLAKQSEGQLGTQIDFSESKMSNDTDAIFSSMNDSDTQDDDDELYGSAKQTVVEAGKASTSYLQRKLGVGYARAARLMDLLEDRGVIGAADGAKPRTIIGEGNADDLAKEYNDETGE